MKTHLVIHHSATRDSVTLSWPVIRKAHMDRGWRDIGYHYGIEWHDRAGPTPGYYEMMIGRTLTERAAGEPKEGMNYKGVHVCFVGNFDIERPKLELWQFAMPHLAAIVELFDIPIENVLGHREIADVATYKKCPGVRWDMARFRTMLGGQP